MNNATLLGTVYGDAEVIYTSPDGEKQLYKFVLKIPNPHKQNEGDLINVKVWSNSIEDEYILHDQAYLGIEGRINSFTPVNSNSTAIFNDVLASRVFYMN